MVDYKSINSMIIKGYEYLAKGNTTSACDSWLEAWGKIKFAIAETKLNSIEELQSKYNWSEFLINYTQDLEAELHNAGLSNKEYFQKRIMYCKEVISLYNQTDILAIGNSRRAIADSYYRLGDKPKCDELYSTWINENPDWGYGYIGWADCYWFDKSKDPQNLKKAKDILVKALSRINISDRFEILERAIDLFEQLGETQEAEVFKKEIKQIERFNPLNNDSIPVRSEKIGRNDPCPCGSSKKYKKCCG